MTFCCATFHKKLLQVYGVYIPLNDQINLISVNVQLALSLFDEDEQLGEDYRQDDLFLACVYFNRRCSTSLFQGESERLSFSNTTRRREGLPSPVQQERVQKYQLLFRVRLEKSPDPELFKWIPNYNPSDTLDKIVEVALDLVLYY